ncbi:uncharacterized protein DS421_10g295530 [Arachis hypogaea]|nr:uncharacterized protein DS421_10g295530 [Arachis hypogaea]
MAGNIVQYTLEILIIGMVIYLVAAELHEANFEQHWTPFYHISKNLQICLGRCERLFTLDLFRRMSCISNCEYKHN